MSITRAIKDFQSLFLPSLTAFLKKECQHANAIDQTLQPFSQAVADFSIHSGKCIRPALFYYGYQCFTDESLEQALHVSMAFELIQSFLLIHDDIIDDAHERRHRPTLNKTLGNANAILAGDVSGYLGLLAIFQSIFPEKNKLALAKEYARVCVDEAYGQTLDIAPLNFSQLDEKKIHAIYHYKTARYTTELPLMSAALLANQDESIVQQFKQLGYWLGLAFQLQDDILGIFGNEKITGKSASSDILQGKKTLLIYLAWQEANTAQRKILQSSYGNPHTTQTQDCLNIMHELAILEKARMQLTHWIDTTKKMLDALTLRAEGKQFIDELIRFLIARDF